MNFREEMDSLYSAEVNVGPWKGFLHLLVYLLVWFRGVVQPYRQFCLVGGQIWGGSCTRASGNEAI